MFLHLNGEIKTDEKKKTPNKKYVNITPEDFIKINPLPDSIDWGEIEKFLIETRYGDIPYSERFNFTDNWEESPTVMKYELSESSIRVLKCLTSDLDTMFFEFNILDENGKEDRSAEYRFLEDWLHTKYSGFSEKLIQRINGEYRIMDR